MTHARLAELAAAFGADLRRWPAVEREDARACLRRDPAAHRLLEAPAGLDLLLDAWTLAPPGAALSGRIAASVAPRQTRLGQLRLWLPGLGAGAALALGIAVGMVAVSLSARASAEAGSSLYGLSVLGAPLDLPQTLRGGPH